MDDSGEEMLSYRLHIISDAVLGAIDRLCIIDNANILKIGTGQEGAFEKYLAKRAPRGNILSLSTYQPQVDACEDTTKEFDNIHAKKMHARNIDFHNEFDLICSFFCLVFSSDPLDVYKKIYSALKPQGQMLLITQSDRNTIYNTFHKVLASGKVLGLENITFPYNFNTLSEIEHTLERLPFRTFTIDTPTMHVELPSLDFYRHLLEEQGFMYEDILAPETIQKMYDEQTACFDIICKERFGGKYIYEYMAYIVSAVK